MTGPHKPSGFGRKPNLIGAVFGRLRVVALAPIQKDRLTWECLCECGAKRDVRGMSLINGTTKSCGCLRRERMRALGRSPHTRLAGGFRNLLGLSFGRLSVVTRLPNGYGRSQWECLCECGNRLRVSSLSLTNRTRRDCGCGAIERRRQAAIQTAMRGLHERYDSALLLHARRLRRKLATEGATAQPPVADEAAVR